MFPGRHVALRAHLPSSGRAARHAASSGIDHVQYCARPFMSARLSARASSAASPESRMSTMPAHCTFCDLIHGAAEVSLCYEDSDAIAFMDIQPVNDGHVLVVPREHFETLSEVPRELGQHLYDVAMRLVPVIQHVTGSRDINLVVNSGAEAGQDVFHYHLHLIPRKAGDGFDIPLPFPGSSMPDRWHLDATAARIIAALRDPMRATRAPNERSRRGDAKPAPVGKQTH
jgi:histidine triad (HIT) family protein